MNWGELDKKRNKKASRFYSRVYDQFMKEIKKNFKLKKKVHDAKLFLDSPKYMYQYT